MANPTSLNLPMSRPLTKIEPHARGGSTKAVSTFTQGFLKKSFTGTIPEVRAPSSQKMDSEELMEQQSSHSGGLNIFGSLPDFKHESSPQPVKETIEGNGSKGLLSFFGHRIKEVAVSSVGAAKIKTLAGNLQNNTPKNTSSSDVSD
jgi:hypothetical protein